jgi:hypothetical protein
VPRISSAVRSALSCGQRVRGRAVVAARETVDREVQRPDPHDRRLFQAAVGELEPSVVEAQPIDREGGQAAPGRGLRFVAAHAFDHAADIAAAVRLDDDVHEGRLERRFGEVPGALEQAAQLEVGLRPVPSGQRFAAAAREREVVDAEPKGERIEAHVADRQPLVEPLRHASFELPPEDGGRGEEADQRIEREQPRGRDHRHAEQDASQAVLPFHAFGRGRRSVRAACLPPRPWRRRSHHFKPIPAPQREPTSGPQRGGSPGAARPGVGRQAAGQP